MKINPENLVGVYDRGCRYLAFEPDGGPPNGFGFQWKQRPTAVARCELNGLGLYDRREDAVILEPDADKRLDHYAAIMDRAREEEKAAATRYASIFKATSAVGA